MARDEAALRAALGAARMTACPPWPDWDLKVGLERERKWRGLAVPSYLRQWINLKVAFGAAHSQCAPTRRQAPCMGCLPVLPAKWCRMGRKCSASLAAARSGSRVRPDPLCPRHAGCMATCARAWRRPA